MSDEKLNSNIWTCKIGGKFTGHLPAGADFPMRRAIESAYKEITGVYPDFLFSGWGAELTESEREVIEGRAV